MKSDKIIFTVEIPHDVEQRLMQEAFDNGVTYTRANVVSNAVHSLNDVVREQNWLDDKPVDYAELDNGVIVSYSLSDEYSHEVKKKIKELREEVEKAKEQTNYVKKLIEKIITDVEEKINEHRIR